MKKYLTGPWIEGIQIVEIVRETAKNVWIKRAIGEPAKHLKSAADGYVYHDTWKDARAVLVDRADRRFKAAQRDLEIRRIDLMDAIALPDDEPEATR